MTQKYSGRLFPVEAGQVITFCGKATASAERFDFDLTSANGNGVDPGDIPLHFSVRFSGDIVRNAHTRGVGWGNEERAENLLPNSSGNPIKRGAAFKIAIYVDSNMFFVSIDGKPFCTFPHRKALNEIQRISIHRDVEEIYQIDQTSAQPVQWPTPSNSVFTSLAPKQFRAGSVIVLSATPRGNRGNFAINLRENGSERVLLHIRSYLSQGVIALNDQDANDNWRSAIDCKPSPFPFNVQQRFKLAIAFTNQNFSIAVNGCRIASFPYRYGAHKIFQSAVGFDIQNRDGLSLEVHGIDHMMSDACCNGFERY